MAPLTSFRLGATPIAANRTRFVVWAPLCRCIEIEIVQPRPARIRLDPDEQHYFIGEAEVAAGAQYYVVPKGEGEGEGEGESAGEGEEERRPDPASRHQPQDVHGPSEVIDPAFNWTDAHWHGLPMRDYIIYELHVGTFTAEGTFDAAIDRLDRLVDLGVTAIEIMPVAQFPGLRNWGYDGVLPYAVQNSYGGPAGLKRLVDAAHAQGIACLLDVVYNHVGPEGNYLGEFAPYFTSKYRTPWGPAINVDAEFSDGVRNYFVANALEWATDYHFDGLRLDAVHGILDTSARPFLAELSDAVHTRAAELERPIVLIAESDLNDVRMLKPTRQGGMGMDAQWLDDFHHSLHSLLTGEQSGYYVDYGSVDHFATALRQGFVYTGNYSAYRKRRHGNSPNGTRPDQFVICIQNHDQVGNRMLGERISMLVDFERLKLGAACVLLAPYIPLMFMGEEYGEEKPFQYFIDHSNAEVVEAVRRGRKEEFAAFSWQGEPPDPKSEHTFATAIVEPHTRTAEEQHALHELYRTLIALRKQYRLDPAGSAQRDVVGLGDNSLLLLRKGSAFVCNFSQEPHSAALPLPRGHWSRALCTAASEWAGPGDGMPQDIASSGSVHLELPPTSAVLFVDTGSAP